MPVRTFHPENKAEGAEGFGFSRVTYSSSSSLTLEQLDGMTQASRAQSRATSDVSPVLEYTADVRELSLPSLSLQQACCGHWSGPTSPSATRPPDFVPTRAFNADFRPLFSNHPPLAASGLHMMYTACGVPDGPPVAHTRMEPSGTINCMLPERERVVWSTLSSTAGSMHYDPATESPPAIYRTDPVLTSISEDPRLKAHRSRPTFQPIEVDPHQRLRLRTPLKENAHPVLHLSHEEIKLNSVPEDLGLGVRMSCRAESPAEEAPAEAEEAPRQSTLSGSLLTNLSPSPGSLAKSRALYVSKRIFKGHLKSDFEPSTQPVHDKSAHPPQTQASQYSLQEIPAFLKNDVVSGRRIRYTAPVLTPAGEAGGPEVFRELSPRVSHRPSVAAESPEENVPNRRMRAQKTSHRNARCSRRPSLRSSPKVHESTRIEQPGTLTASSRQRPSLRSSPKVHELTKCEQPGTLTASSRQRPSLRSSPKVHELTKSEQPGTLTASSREYVTTQRISRQFGDSPARSTLPNLAEGAPITSLSARVSLRSPSPRLEQPSIGKLSGNPLFAVFNE